jgi:hypothetical protein
MQYRRGVFFDPLEDGLNLTRQPQIVLVKQSNVLRRRELDTDVALGDPADFTRNRMHAERRTQRKRSNALERAVGGAAIDDQKLAVVMESVERRQSLVDERATIERE